ncbi:MAG: nodulation protein NfeD [Thiotrichales bacterium]
MVRTIGILVGLIVTLVGVGWSEVTTAESKALMLEVRGAISPASQDLIRRTLQRAHDEDAALLILQLDTPGGLDHSMREIIRDILASRVPVATYVAPSGSRAASAGTYILYASHIAAMAPATNLGSATPVRIGGLPELPGKPEAPGAERDSGKDDGDAMQRKLVNDAAAYIKGLARTHGRNEVWAEQAVREAVNLTAFEALEQGVIDVVANDSAELLRLIDGRTVKLRYGEITLATRDLPVEIVVADWRTELLSVITDPNVAYILLLIGIYGLIFEFSNPGFILPGVVGAIALLLALYALHVLPISYAGIALLFIGLAFMVAEAFVPSGGVLGIGGLIAFVIGSIVLFDDQHLAVSIPTIGGTALVSATFLLWVINRFIRLRRRPAVSGLESLIGADAEVLEDFSGRGRVRIAGEIWSAHSVRPVRKGQIARVAAIDKLIVEVDTKE